LLDIEDRLTLDERSAVDFVLGLRKRWADTVYPALVEEFDATGAPRPTSVIEAEEPLHELSLYPWFSHLERAQQKMLWKIASDAVIDRRQELLEQMGNAPAGPGSLELDPDIQLPDWYTGYDIHIQPGGVYSDNLSAYVYEFGARIVMLRDNDGYKFHTLFATTALPELPAATRWSTSAAGSGRARARSSCATRRPR
jgi:hypothetical protein